MRRISSKLFGWLTSLLAVVGAPALVSASPKPQGGIVSTYFFVGGHYSGEGPAQAMSGQMYVQKLEPAKVTQRFPIVMIHGTAQTGNSFLATPDGRPGWAHDFAERGYRVFVVDQVGRARSGTSVKAYGAYASPTMAFVQLTVGPRHSGLWPQVSLHTQWPGEAAPGEAFFDQFMAQQVEYIASGVDTEKLNLPANLALLEKVGPAILLTHSQAGVFGWKLSDLRPDLVKAHIAVEPNGPPFFDVKFVGGKDWYAYNTAEVARASGIARLPLHFVPELSAALQPVQEPRADGPNLLPCWLQAAPARQLPNIAKVPSVVVTGEASYRSTYDHCTVRFLTQAGVPVTHLRLEKQEIRGNGHMMMLENNSSEISAALHRWLVKSGLAI